LESQVKPMDARGWARRSRAKIGHQGGGRGWARTTYASWSAEEIAPHCYREVATDEVRKASWSHASNSPSSSEHTDVRTARPSENTRSLLGNERQIKGGNRYGKEWQSRNRSDLLQATHLATGGRNGSMGGVRPHTCNKYSINTIMSGWKWFSGWATPVPWLGGSREAHASSWAGNW